MTAIPNPPSTGDEFTNDATGVTYRFDGQRWLAVSSTADDVIDGITDEIGKLTARVADGETVQSGIQQALVDLEAAIPSSDEFYLKTGGDINGYVYTKGNTAGYYLGSQDGDNLISLTEKAAQEAHLQLRNRTLFKVTGYAPGDNQAFPYVNLNTNEVNGLKVQRLADPVQGHDAVNKNYVDSVVANSFQHPGMGLRWTYTTGNATTGKFTIEDNEFIYINSTTADGRSIFSSLNSTDQDTHAARPLITIYDVVGGEMLIYGVFNCKQTRFGHNATGRMQFIYDASVQPLGLGSGGKYYITIGGLC